MRVSRLLVCVCESITAQDITYLPHLIRLRLPNFQWLNVDDFRDVLSAKNVVVSSYRFDEADVKQYTSDIFKCEVRIRPPTQKAIENLSPA